MSLFQCENCGCCENTALSFQGHKLLTDSFDWTGKEELEGKMLCSSCGPEKFADGTTNPKGGGWHGKFERVFLPLGEWKTNQQGNLEHIRSGDTNYRNHSDRIR